MTTPKLVLTLALLTVQAALLSAGIYLLIKARRRDRAALHHATTTTAYWQHRAHAGDTRTIALFLVVGSFVISHITLALSTD